MMDDKQKIIVSLTSFPAAIPYAVQAIRSVLAGSLLPDKIVLYLDTQKFPGGVLPPELEALKAESEIFEVRFDPAEIRSYKKLIPALRDFPEDVIVTIDDDIFYHPNMLRDLLKLHRHLPEAIIAHRVRKVVLGAPYRKWRKYKWYDFVFKRLHFDYHAMQTGGHLVLGRSGIERHLCSPITQRAAHGQGSRKAERVLLEDHKHTSRRRPQPHRAGENT